MALGFKATPYKKIFGAKHIMPMVSLDRPRREKAAGRLTTAKKMRGIKSFNGNFGGNY